jgi:hypothetical protein
MPFILRISSRIETLSFSPVFGRRWPRCGAPGKLARALLLQSETSRRRLCHVRCRSMNHRWLSHYRKRAAGPRSISRPDSRASHRNGPSRLRSLCARNGRPIYRCLLDGQRASAFSVSRLERCILRLSLISLPARQPRSDHLRVGSTGISEPLTLAEPRLGRRTALTFPLFPPPQKN